MAEPFVFYFSPDESGDPQIMYITDLSCVCGLCMHPGLQRFYHATPFHKLTWKVWHELLHDARNKAEYECENCGTPVRGEHVVCAVVRLGFADESGEIIARMDYENSDAPEITQILVPERRLDPQVQPDFAPLSEPSYKTLNDEILWDVLGRVLNIKVVWQHVLLSWLDAPDQGTSYEQVSHDCWVIVDEFPDCIENAMNELDQNPQLRPIALQESAPGALATHRYPENIHGHFKTWCTEEQVEMLEQRMLFADAWVSPESIHGIVERAFETARLRWEYEEDEEEGGVFHSIETPRGDEYPSDLYVDSILDRAVYTGLTPGDAARLTAEEIVGVLLKVWN